MIYPTTFNFIRYYCLDFFTFANFINKNLNTKTMVRYIVIGVSAAFLIIYLYYKWRRTSKYVDDSAKAYTENQKNRMEYTQRCKQDKKWDDFLNMLKDKYKVSMEKTGDPDTYEIFDISLISPEGIPCEPNSEASENGSIAVYLKRKSNPKYLLVYSAGNILMEKKVNGSQWYNLFESAI
jgi:hypothetical protein